MLILTETESQKVYFTADPHLGHQRDFVWEYRGHASYEEHTSFVIDTTNEIVRPNDILIVIGDFCLNTPIERFHEYIARINCSNVWMVWGNHNNPHERKVYQPETKKYLVPTAPLYMEVYPVQYQNVKYLGHYFEAVINEQRIVMFHYPISVWNEMQNGAWHLCGHSHYNFQPSMAEDSASKILDVGWDGHKKPWSFEEVAEVMATKSVPVVDHHV